MTLDQGFYVLFKSFFIHESLIAIFTTGLIVFIVLTIIGRVFPKQFSNINLTNILFVISLIILLSFFVGALLYLWKDKYPGGFYSTLAIIVYNNLPLYHDMESYAARYSIAYGPIPFLIWGGVFKIFYPSLFIIQFTCVIIETATLFLSYFSLRKFAGFKHSLIGVSYIILTVSMATSYGIGSDYFTYLFLSLALFGITRRNQIQSIILCSIAFGMIINVKLFGIVYLFPIMVLLYKRFGGKTFIISGVLSLFIAFLPYLLPNVSLTNYYNYIVAGSSNPMISANNLIRNFKFITIYQGIPFIFLLAYKYLNEKDKFDHWAINNSLLWCVLWLSIVIIFISRSENGVGPQHMMPPTITVLFIVFYEIRKIKIKKELLSISNKLIFCWLIGLIFFVGWSSIPNYIGEVKKRFSYSIRDQIIGDINTIIKKYPSKNIQMGIGEKKWSEVLTYSNILDFKGYPRFIATGGPARGFQSAGIKTPQKTIELLENCFICVWLIPKNEKPFESHNPTTLDIKLYVNPNIKSTKLFDKTFRQTFNKNYKKTSQSRFFDIYECR